MSEVADEFTEDAFLGGKLQLRQPRSGHRAGHDAMLLAAAVSARSGDRVIDFGAGVGAAGLAVATRIKGIDLALVEIDEKWAGLARHNAAANALAADVVVLDLTSQAEAFAAAGLLPDSADAILMNPPFNNSARHRASPDKAREVAHVSTSETLDRWIHAARRTLKSAGHLTLIWRADGMAEVLAALDRGFGSLVILPVHSDAEGPAIRILLRAVKGGKAPARLLPSLSLRDSVGPSAQAQAILAGEAVLPMGDSSRGEF